MSTENPAVPYTKTDPNPAGSWPFPHPPANDEA